ncbi:hypothetical protein BH11PLA1_BH11PLA1_00030 [soil metagenome]
MARPSALSKFSMAELHSEIQRRDKASHALKQEHATLRGRLQQLESLIGKAGGMLGLGGGSSSGSGSGSSSSGAGSSGGGGSGGKRGRGRPKGSKNKGSSGGGGDGRSKRFKNEKSLVTYLKDSLSGKTMGVQDAMDAVRKSGYQSNSPSFRTIVNQALLSKKNGFKKVARGQYSFEG